MQDVNLSRKSFSNNGGIPKNVRTKYHLITGYACLCRKYLFSLVCIRNCCRRTQSGGNYYRSMYLISHYKIYWLYNKCWGNQVEPTKKKIR